MKSDFCRILYLSSSQVTTMSCGPSSPLGVCVVGQSDVSYVLPAFSSQTPSPSFQSCFDIILSFIFLSFVVRALAFLLSIRTALCHRQRSRKPRRPSISCNTCHVLPRRTIDLDLDRCGSRICSIRIEPLSSVVSSYP